MIVYKNANRTEEPGVFTSLWATGELAVRYRVGETAEPHPDALAVGHGLWVYKTLRDAQSGEPSNVILVCEVEPEDEMEPCRFLPVSSSDLTQTLTLSRVVCDGGPTVFPRDDATMIVRKVRVLCVKEQR